LFSRYLCVALCVAKQRKQRSVIFKITEPEHYVFWGKNFAAKLCCGAVFSKINTKYLFKFCKLGLQNQLGNKKYIFYYLCFSAKLKNLGLLLVKLAASLFH
jgi:hypothetical protein